MYHRTIADRKSELLLMNSRFIPMNEPQVSTSSTPSEQPQMVQGCNPTIQWISNHNKVKGNEEADRLTKDAAAGRSSAMADLPHILRNLFLDYVTTTRPLTPTLTPTLVSWSPSWESKNRIVNGFSKMDEKKDDCNGEGHSQAYGC
jgi:hypothetical protein